METNNMTFLTMDGNIDKLGKITDANEQAIKLFGYDRDQILNHKVNKLMPDFYSKHHD
jgi:PAS domain S-box-containing protein